jgi:hypothetical protein
MYNYYACLFHLKTFQVFYENGKIVKNIGYSAFINDFGY